ncbi:hypothetical protein HK097_000572 [Rhizophlyctis rosea]|uniref:Uncharacterized protein n=1 Tax=Rhizophlyctis rosea TaxID=64517 RepID=A0AAD5SL33_9FUNG|nr:hypothetical protein HK097_000572 [Rhizophlyctis rosea]
MRPQKLQRPRQWYRIGHRVVSLLAGGNKLLESRETTEPVQIFIGFCIMRGRWRERLRMGTGKTWTSFQGEVEEGRTELPVDVIGILLGMLAKKSEGSPAASSEITSTIKTQWTKKHQMAPLQLLQTLRAALHQEIRKTSFAYISLHTHCLRILRDISAGIREYHFSELGRNYLEEEYQLSTIVGYVFQDVAAVADISEAIGATKQVGRSQGRATIESDILLKSCEILNDWLERERDTEIEKVAGIVGKNGV